MERLKASRYNYYLSEEGIVANTRSGASAILERAVLQALQENRLDRLTQDRQLNLIEKGMLVLAGTDETAKVLEARKRRTNCFRILTTTACNASCAYCYQKDLPCLFMDGWTALQTAAFILRQMQGQREAAELEWFGGEPLLNTEAIDIICSRLRSENLKFMSSITTNASVFSLDLLRRIREDWNLFHVQVTLDGIGNRHDTMKGLIPGTFDRILESLKFLMDQHIFISVRINHTDSAAETELLTFLSQTFAGYSDRLRICISPLYQARGEARIKAMKEILELRKKLCELQFALTDRIFCVNPLRSRCRAAEGGYTIAPDGRLYSCVHCMTDRDCFGTVWKHEENHSAREVFMSRDLTEQCRECLFLPVCLGGCRAAELGRVPMDQCLPDSLVFAEMMRMRFQIN